MRVTSISMLSNDKEAISFDLRNVASQSPYMVKTIIGLDADELIPRFYGFSKNGTKKFYDFKLKPRDIVMRIVMNPRFNLDESTSYIRAHDQIRGAIFLKDTRASDYFAMR